jgi:hypothetical protein
MEATPRRPSLSNDILAKIVVTAVVVIAFAFWLSLDKAQIAYQANSPVGPVASHP